MTPWEYAWLVGAMGAVTYGPRALPLVLLARRRLPEWLVAWLDLVPPAILAALLAPPLFATADPREVDLLRPELWAALPTLLFAWRTRSLGGTVVFGMGLFWLCQKLS